MKTSVLIELRLEKLMRTVIGELSSSLSPHYHQIARTASIFMEVKTEIDLRYTGIYDGAYSLVKTNWTHFDGDGRKVKSTDWENNQTANSYYFNSSVLGRLLFEVDGSGGFKKAYAYSPSGQLLARQESNGVTWITTESQGATTKETNSSGTVTGTNELDPLGRAVDSSGAYNYDGTNDYGVPAAGFYTPGSVPGVCGTTFGVSMSCGIVRGTGIQERGIQERIADNDWSLSRLRPNGEFWDNLDRGYVMIPEFEDRRDSRTIVYRKHWIAPWRSEWSGMPVTNGNACTLMAEKVASLVNAVIGSFGGAEKITNHQEIDKLLKSVLDDLVQFYVGKGVDSGGAIVQKRPYGGADGFQMQFVDSINPAEDQTHHFVGYFYAGANNNVLEATLHKWGTDYDNPGDRALSDVSYSMGQDMMMRSVARRTNNGRYGYTVYDPEPVKTRLARILEIADRIRSEICVSE